MALLHTPPWIALTGGIASGKSSVANEFAQLGVPVIDLDVLARQVVAPTQPAFTAVVNHFGPAILTAEGQLNRRALRERVFNHPDDKRALEAILHPAIRAAQLALAKQLSGPYQIHVVPLLVEKHSEALYDRVLVVDCPRTTQLQRLIQRDGIPAQLAEDMLAAQADRQTRLACADDILENNGDLSALTPQVAVLHQRYLQLATTASAN